MLQPNTNKPHGSKRGLQREAELGGLQPTTTVTEPNLWIREGGSRRKTENRRRTWEKQRDVCIDYCCSGKQGRWLVFLLQNKGRDKERRGRKGKSEWEQRNRIDLPTVTADLCINNKLLNPPFGTYLAPLCSINKAVVLICSTYRYESFPRSLTINCRGFFPIRNT